MYQLKKLSSGLRILTVPVKNTKVFTLLVLVGTGSKYETKRINGISHFLEHMFFKGTADRPQPGEVNRALDSIGAQHNAFTSKELTGYWVKAAQEHFEVALDVVSDILTSPLLATEEIDRERGVIIQELRMRNDDPMSRAALLFEKLLWGDQPSGWEIIGSEDTIQSLQQKDFQAYFNQHYIAKNTLVVLGGAVPRNATTCLERAFAVLRRGTLSGKEKVIETQRAPQVLFEKKDIEASNLILGFRGHSLYDRNRFIEDVLATLLGGNSSSRLYMELREKRGLAYYIRAGATRYTDTGYFEISAGVPHHQISQALDVIIAELQRIKKNGVTSAELKKAKDYIRGTTQIELEDSSALTSFFGEQVIFKKPVETPDQLLKKIDAVSAAEIKRIAQKLFVSSSANLVMVGGNHEQAELKNKLEKI